MAGGAVGSEVEAEEHAASARSDRVLLVAATILRPVVGPPLFLTAAHGAARLNVHEEKLADGTGSATELTITPLRGRPVKPIVKACTVLFGLTSKLYTSLIMTFYIRNCNRRRQR